MKKLATVAFLIGFAVAASALAAEDGKALYDSKCAMCHGPDGVAKKMAAGSKNFNDPAWKKSASTDEVVKIVKEGKGKMKGMGEKLNADQMKAIAEYVMTLAK